MKIIFALFLFLTTGFAKYEKPIYFLDLKGSINPGSAAYIIENLNRANSEGAAALILQLDTPGGLLSSTRSIIQSISSSSIPVIVFIAPGGASATSAGALITISAHYSAMAKGTNIGAAHPVGSSGEDVKGTMGEKITNDTAALARSQATLRHRNPEIAELVVTKSKSFAADEAVQNGLSNLVVKDLNELLLSLNQKKICLDESCQKFSLLNTEGLTPDSLMTKTMNLKQKFLHLIADPNISTLLMTLGGLAIYVEVSSGFSSLVAGIIGAFCILLGLISMQTLPIQAGGALLFVLGFLLLAAEAFFTSHGLLAVSSVICISLGGLFLIDPASSSMKVSLSLLLPIIGGISTVILFISFIIARDNKRRRKSISTLHSPVRISTINKDGLTGTAYVNGELWNFESKEHVNVKEKYFVHSITGLKLHIERRN